MTQYKLRAKSYGFSLLELLIVIVIVGILSSIAIINIRSEDSRPKIHAERLGALVQLAADEAMIHGQEMGLKFYPKYYEFSVQDPSRGIWDIMKDDDMFRSRYIEDDLELELLIEDQKIVVQSPSNQWDKQEYMPQIFILSSGEITPFKVKFRNEFSGVGYMLNMQTDASKEIIPDEF